MKNLFLALFLFLVLIGLCTQCSAQNAVPKYQVASIVPSVTPSNDPMTAFKNVHIRAVRDFKTAFAAIDHESWYIMPDGYRARFINNGTIYIVTYNKNGRWLHTIRKYDDSKLNKDVLQQVKTMFGSYSITLVEEFEQPQKPVTWLVHIEDKVSLKNIMVCNREMETVQDIIKL